jgi:hypothetical protein
MRTLSRSPSRYGSRLKLAGFPISDMFGQEATAVISNEVAGRAEARKKRSFPSLPMPGVRGAMARAEDHDYVAAPRRLLDSVHVAQELAWLDAEVTWSAAAGEPQLAVEHGTMGREGESGEVAVRFDGGAGAIVMPAGGPALRCHALLFCLGVEAGTGEPELLTTPVAVRLQAREAGAWALAATFPMPGSGTYLGLVALEKKPRTIESVQLAFEGATRVRVYDLALLTFG